MLIQEQQGSAKERKAQEGHAIRFPDVAASDLDQDQEWFEFLAEGEWRRLRIHDYDEIYKVPGLYEALVYESLRCRSPKVVTSLLSEVLDSWDTSLDDLRVLDLGAGNGVVGEILKDGGVEHVVGVDLLPEAAMAAERDRPGVYDDYVVADLTHLSSTEEQRLQEPDLNCLTTVAALGFGDIPPRAFAVALNQVSDAGYVAMCIKEDFLEGDNRFSLLTQRLADEGIVEPQAHMRYRHRTAITGEPIFYVALIGRKLGNVPEELLVEIEA